MTSRYGTVILLLIANLTQYSYLCLYWERLYLFCTDWLTDDNEDNAPFQIDPLGVQAEQLHCIKPPVGENLFSGTPPRRSRALPRTSLVSHWHARSLPLDFNDVPLAFEESAF